MLAECKPRNVVGWDYQLEIKFDRCRLSFLFSISFGYIILFLLYIYFLLYNSGVKEVVVIVVRQTVGFISSKTLAYDCLYTLELCMASLIATS